MTSKTYQEDYEINDEMAIEQIIEVVNNLEDFMIKQNKNIDKQRTKVEADLKKKTEEVCKLEKRIKELEDDKKVIKILVDKISPDWDNDY